MPFVVIILILITSITTFDLVVRPSGFFTNVLTDKTIDTMIIAISVFYLSYFYFNIEASIEIAKNIR